MQSAKYSAFALALTVMILTLGCNSGPEMGTVSGTVTIDGTPAAGLEVSFDPKQAGTGTTALGFTDASGAYKLSYPGGQAGAPVGEYTVSVVAAEVDGEGTPPAAIPACYNSATVLSFTVSAGENTANFDLKSAGE